MYCCPVLLYRRRSYEDVELVMQQPGGALAQGGAAPESVEQRFSVLHRADLLGGTMSWLWCSWGLRPSH